MVANDSCTEAICEDDSNTYITAPIITRIVSMCSIYMCRTLREISSPLIIFNIFGFSKLDDTESSYFRVLSQTFIHSKYAYIYNVHYFLFIHVKLIYNFFLINFSNGRLRQAAEMKLKNSTSFLCSSHFFVGPCEDSEIHLMSRSKEKLTKSSKIKSKSWLRETPLE